jgi:hypothetical protein
VLLRMLTNLRLADTRQTTAHQRSTGQNRPSHLYTCVVFYGVCNCLGITEHCLKVSEDREIWGMFESGSNRRMEKIRK